MGRLERSLLLVALSFATRASAESRSISLSVGGSQAVQFPAGTDLSVSRRGIVDLFHAGDGRWEITALRGGFAVVDGKDALTGEPRSPRLFVTVGSAEDHATVSLIDGLPSWICKPRGIRCDKQAGIISGTVDDHLWFQRAQEFCARDDACLFAAELSAKGVANRKGRFRLAAKIFLVEDGAAEELGFDGGVDASLAFRKGKSDLSLLSRLRALARDHRAEILGEPLFRMTPGEEAQLVNGGEFQVFDRTTTDSGTREVTTWKQHGLGLKLRLTPLGSGRARLTYDLSLKSPTEARTALTVNSLHSQVDLPIGSPVLVGVLDLEAKMGESHSSPPFASIPLIGPLFRGTGKQSSKSRLGFWLQLDEDVDQPLTGPWTP